MAGGSMEYFYLKLLGARHLGWQKSWLFSWYFSVRQSVILLCVNANSVKCLFSLFILYVFTFMFTVPTVSYSWMCSEDTTLNSIAAENIWTTLFIFFRQSLSYWPHWALKRGLRKNHFCSHFANKCLQGEFYHLYLSNVFVLKNTSYPLVF